MNSDVEFRDEEHGVTVLAGGFPQSFVDPDDPTFLPFEYVQHLAACLDVLPDGPLAVTHVGGAGLSLPRYVQATRPGSPQIVLEPDEALTAAVREVVPLPRGHRIRVRGVDGATGVAALKGASADVVVLDAFAGGRVPAELTTVAWFAQVERVLRRGGVLLANLTDEPGLRYAARVLAGMAEAGLVHRSLLATHDILKGRRFGNVVVVAGRDELPMADLGRRLRRSPFPTGLRTPGQLVRMTSGARPFTDDATPSPPPPAADRWRPI